MFHLPRGGHPALTQALNSSTFHRTSRPHLVAAGTCSEESNSNQDDREILSNRAASVASTMSRFSGSEAEADTADAAAVWPGVSAVGVGSTSLSLARPV